MHRASTELNILQKFVVHRCSLARNDHHYESGRTRRFSILKKRKQKKIVTSDCVTCSLGLGIRSLGLKICSHVFYYIFMIVFLGHIILEHVTIFSSFQRCLKKNESRKLFSYILRKCFVVQLQCHVAMEKNSSYISTHVKKRIQNLILIS